MVMKPNLLNIWWSTLLVLGLAATRPAAAINVSADATAVGAILNPRAEIQGTAFAVGPRLIVTCLHVVPEEMLTYLYQPLRATGEQQLFRLKRLSTFPTADLVVMIAETNVTEKPCRLGELEVARVGYELLYMGLRVSRTNAPALDAFSCTVEASGVARTEAGQVSFVEFYGRGLPGFSGGPVFNASGEIVAVMREAWTKRGVKGGSAILVNRAFSVELIQGFLQKGAAFKER